MGFEGYVSIAALVLSIIIGVSGIRKGKADTFSSYQDSLSKAQKNYTELSARVDQLEKELNGMKTWNKALVNQLMDNGITPITMEQAIKYCNKGVEGGDS